MIDATIIKEAKGLVDKDCELDIDKFFQIKGLDMALKGLFITKISKHKEYFIEESIVDKKLYVKKRKIPLSTKYPEVWALSLVLITAVATVLIERLFQQKNEQEIQKKLLLLDSTTNRANVRVDSLINSPPYQLKNDSATIK